MGVKINVEKLGNRFDEYREAYAKADAKKYEIRYQVIILWYSPISHSFETRTAFFSDLSEAEMYKENAEMTYDTLEYYHTIELIYLGDVK